MQVKYINHENLMYLKNNMDTLRPYFLQSDNKPLLKKLGEDFFTTRDQQIPDNIKLILESDSKYDAQNAITIYSKLSMLSNVQATDIGFWAWLNICHLFEYIKIRWSINNNTTSDQLISYFLFNSNSRRDLTRNASSRLWWIARLTIDENNVKDKFHLTKFVGSKARFVGDILERNLSNNPFLVKTISNFIKEKSEHYKMTTNHVRDILKNIDFLSGLYILDCMSEKDLLEKFNDHFESLNLPKITNNM